MSWPTTTYNGVEYYMFDGLIFIPVDPSTGAPILMLKPHGFAVGSGIPAVADGPPGPAATFQTGPFTELAANDPTPGGLTVTEVSPGLYAIGGALHRGADGEPGTTSIDLDSIGGTAAAGNIIKVNAAANGFDFAFEKVAERYVPASINNTAAGNPQSTLAIIPIAAKNFDRRVFVTGDTIVTQNGGANVVVDFVARLNDETGGNVIARCPGIGGTERLMFSSAPPPGAADAFDKVPAGEPMNVYVRTEQQGGSNSYTTSNSTTRAAAWAIPVG